MFQRLISGMVLFIGLAFLMPADVNAQLRVPNEDPAKQVHWATGAFFGTGWYRVSENRSVFIFRIPPRQTVRRASIDEEGNRTLGIEIQYPLSLGLHSLDQLDDFLDFDNYGTISFTPGVQVEIPVNRKWSLRPYAHIGAGYETTTSESAWIYYGGIKSRYRLGGEESNFSLLNAIYLAGYKPEFDKRGQYGSAMIGLEGSRPIRNFQLGGDDVYLNWHVTYNYMFDKMNFHVDEDRQVTIRDQWELGLALGKGGEGLKIWFLTFEHVGLSYRISSNGKFRGLSVNFRSPFTY